MNFSPRVCISKIWKNAKFQFLNPRWFWVMASWNFDSFWHLKDFCSLCHFWTLISSSSPAHRLARGCVKISWTAIGIDLKFSESSLLPYLILKTVKLSVWHKKCHFQVVITHEIYNETLYNYIFPESRQCVHHRNSRVKVSEHIL